MTSVGLVAFALFGRLVVDGVCFLGSRFILLVDLDAFVRLARDKTAARLVETHGENPVLAVH